LCIKLVVNFNSNWWTFHFLFFTFFLNSVTSFSFVMFHFEPLSGHGKHDICRANVKELGTFNSWTIYVFVDFRTNDIICPEFHYLSYLFTWSVWVSTPNFVLDKHRGPSIRTIILTAFCCRLCYLFRFKNAR
jgi:hypothetical protein